MFKAASGAVFRRVKAFEGGARTVLTQVLRDGNTVADYQLGIGQTDAGGGACSVWANQIGTAPSLTAAGAARPTIQADGSLLFDGVAQFMATGAFTLNQPTTIYFVGKQITWTASDRIFDGNSADVSEVYQQGTASPSIRISAGTPSVDNNDFSLNTYGIVIALFNGASSLLQVNANTPTAGNFGAGNPGGFTLGTEGTTHSLFANIQVKEIILRNAADSAGTRANIQALLKAIHTI